MFAVAACCIASMCVVLVVSRVWYLKSVLCCVPIRYHSLASPVSVHFTLGLPTLLVTLPLSLMVMGVIVLGWKEVCLMGECVGAVMILLSSICFLSSYIFEYVLSRFFWFSDGSVVVYVCLGGA